jgi:hypothetical protein
MWHGQLESLKELELLVGLDLKLVHQDARLYLISHTSLHKRGFAPGMASVPLALIQMLVAQEHRLANSIPFALKNLQCTWCAHWGPCSLSCRHCHLQSCMHLPHGTGEDSMKRRAEPSLQALLSDSFVGTHGQLGPPHLFLPMALAEATKGAAEWEGLGLLSRWI